MDQYLSMLTSSVLQLQDNKIYLLSNKQIAYESKYVNCDITSKLLASFQKNLSQLETMINLKEQSSLNINLNLLMAVKKGGVKSVVESPKQEWLNPMKVCTVLGNIEMLLDFLCMVKFSRDQAVVLQILEKLSDLYILLVK
jgi:hypothetical protein